MKVMRQKHLGVLLLLLLTVSIALMALYNRNFVSGNAQIRLNPEEKAWLAAHPKVSIGLDPEYAPFEFMDNGNYKGMSIDYLNWIETQIPLHFEYVYYPTWDKVLIAAAEKKIDMTGALIKTEQRSTYLNFTDAYYANFDIILIRTDQKTIQENNLPELRTAVIKDYAIVDYLKEKYPDMPLIEVSNMTEGLKMLSFGDIDAFVTDFSQASYYIQKYGYQNIYAIENSKISKDGDLRFGISKDYPILVNIMNKTLAAMPISTRNELHMKWIGVKFRTLISENALWAILIILSLLTVLAVVTLSVNQLLKREIAAKTKTIQEELDHITSVEEELIQLNLTLEAKVAERTLTLEQVIADLQQTQAQMIESEKMASLGGLVAGVAHEINTPLGIALTTASYMEHISHDFQTQFANGAIKKSDLINYMDTVCDGTQMMNLSLNKAADLVKSFKQLAIDQTSDERKRFSLKDSCDVVIVSLHHEYEPRHIKIINQIPEHIFIDSYPSAFSQIFSHIIRNALQHAFENQLHGEITLSCDVLENQLYLTCRDNGAGLSTETLEHLYEPFYTTKRYAGNSGLGMHIVYNLVNQKLKGSILVTSEANKGTAVQISLPNHELGY